MAKDKYLGEFEQLCLLAVLRRRDDAYGVRIFQEIEDRTGREPNIGSVYATLDRLEEKGFVTSELGEGTPLRSGKPKRYFKIQEPGIDALRKVRQMQNAMWEGVLDVVEGSESA